MPLDLATAENAFRALLLKDNGVTDIVRERIWINAAPQRKKMPYLIVTRDDAEHAHHMTGASGYVIPRISVKGYSKELNPNEIQLLERNVRLALDGRQNITVSVGAENVTLKHISLDPESAGYQSPTDGSQKGIHTFDHDYETGHKEAVGTFT